MKFIIEAECLVNTTYAVEAESGLDAVQKYRNGEAEEVDQNVYEELIMDVYSD